MSYAFLAMVGQNDITVYVLPQLPDPLGLGPGAEVVETISLDPRNKSLPAYTSLLRAQGWTLAGQWDTGTRWPSARVTR